MASQVAAKWRERVEVELAAARRAVQAAEARAAQEQQRARARFARTLAPPRKSPTPRNPPLTPRHPLISPPPSSASRAAEEAADARERAEAAERRVGQWRKRAEEAEKEVAGLRVQAEGFVIPTGQGAARSAVHVPSFSVVPQESSAVRRRPYYRSYIRDQREDDESSEASPPSPPVSPAATDRSVSSAPSTPRSARRRRHASRRSSRHRHRSRHRSSSSSSGRHVDSRVRAVSRDVTVLRAKAAEALSGLPDRSAHTPAVGATRLFSSSFIATAGAPLPQHEASAADTSREPFVRAEVPATPAADSSVLGQSLVGKGDSQWYRRGYWRDKYGVGGQGSGVRAR